MTARPVAVAIVIASSLVPTLGRAEPLTMSLARGQAVPEGRHRPVQTLVAGLVVLALGGMARACGAMGTAPPPSLVGIAWPSLAPPTGTAERAPSWTVPDGGRKPFLFATLVDVRF
jgi:hypothetical protein